ncbi:MAG: DUF2240 family protein [Methanobacteriota archaeon]|nr:MAG: DUF2240 family protein [Euryarchaeota archaeon]
MGGGPAEDVKRAVTFLFRLEGGRPLSEKEFVQFASYRLNWFKPTEAQRLLRVAQDLRLVELRQGLLHTTFDPTGVEVPVDYRPPASVLERAPPAEDLFLKTLRRIEERTGTDRKTLVGEINAIQERMDVQVEVAALIRARALGVDVSDLLDLARDAIVKRSP